MEKTLYDLHILRARKIYMRATSHFIIFIIAEDIMEAIEKTVSLANLRSSATGMVSVTQILSIGLS